MGFDQCFRHRVVVVDEDQGTVSKGAGREGINDRYDTGVVNPLPILGNCQGEVIAESESCFVSEAKTGKR
jgi:hypothetical protein